MMIEQLNSAQPVSSRKGSRRRTYILIGCGAALFLSAAIICSVIGLIAYVAGKPENIVVSYEVPALVTTGESFDLNLQITNTGDADILVGDIDLASMFNPTILEGAVVLSTEPEMEMDYSVPGVKSFRLNRSFTPGERQTVIFHLQAVAPGNYGGPVAVYVGMRSYDVYPSITVTR